MAKLPPELISEFLLCLPVKSLLRFRCVSKSLCSIIDGVDFINSHLNRSSQNINRHKLIFMYRSQKIGRLSSEISRFDVCDMNGRLEAEILLEKPLSSLWKEVYGYCNGLFLLCRGLSKLALWNPSTRHYRYLPDCPFKVPHNVECYGILGLGLCYDSIDGYKAVLILLIDQLVNIETQVWVLTVRSNIWRRVQNIPREYEFKFPGPGFGYFVDGCLHWLCDSATKNNGDLEIIVAFDAGNETFSLVSQPVYPSPGFLTDLHVLEESLCISFFSCSMPLQADLYVRKNDGIGQFTWIKLYSAAEPLSFDIHYFKVVRVLGYSKSRNKILLDFDLEQLVSYDLDEKSFGKIEIEKDCNWYDPLLCVESLVKIGG